MQKHHRFLLASSIVMLNISGACLSSAYAAKPIELNFQTANVLQSFSALSGSEIQFQRINMSTDQQKIVHVRMQETYTGYPVWGAVAIVHTTPEFNMKKSIKELSQDSKATVNGVIYQHIKEDLKDTPAYVFGDDQAKLALEKAISLYGKASSLAADVSEKSTKLMVYVDENNKAHWAFLINFEVQPKKGMLERPSYIMDAITFHVYREWNDIKKLSEVMGGGLGGNLKMGKLAYDSLSGNLPKLDFSRDSDSHTCYLSNNNVTVKDYRNKKLIQFNCQILDAEHGDIYWNADFDTVNGGYSPSNDALYAGKIIQAMYNEWYGVPPLTQDGKPMMLNMVVHLDDDNAYWDGNKMTFGDGIEVFYPLTSLGVAAHEVSHGFTEQHSNLAYYAQSGGLNESFSDMAAQAAEFYSTKKNNWQIGPEIFKEENQALRYMDEPSKDCLEGRRPGQHCSISHMKEYSESLDVHYSSGIFNKVFYLLGTSKGWDTKKAFDVMVKANMAYWTPTIDFYNAANCVLRAAKDLNYGQTVVKKAFSDVGIWGINVNNCK